MDKQYSKLLNERSKKLEQLPNFDAVLRGTVFERYLKCGKKKCHCVSGKGHQAFYVGVTHSKIKTEQISLPKELVHEVKAQVENYNNSIKILNEISEINRDILRLKRKEIKEMRNKNATRKA